MRIRLTLISAAMYSPMRQRRRQQMPEIARIDFLEEGNGEADLAAEEHVPQHDAGEQDPGGLREEARLLDQEGLDETPEDHLHHRPVAEIEKARPRSCDQIPMPQHDGADAPRRRIASIAVMSRVLARAAGAPRRERRPPAWCGHIWRSASFGEPESTMRPALHHQHPIAKPLDFQHVVRGDQERGVRLPAHSGRGNPRTQSAVSGSSDAVGSSSSTMRGRLMNALARPARVR